MTCKKKNYREFLWLEKKERQKKQNKNKTETKEKKKETNDFAPYMYSGSIGNGAFDGAE